MGALRIAYFSPLPPERSGLAGYSHALLPHLAQSAEITLFANEPGRVPASLCRHFDVRAIAGFDEVRWSYDLPLYHMGNHPTYHESIYACLLRYPGVTVLHEVNLHAFYWNRTGAGQNRLSYVREMGYAYGVQGLQQARLITSGARPLPDSSFLLCNRIADVSLGCVVHTRFALQQVLDQVPGARVVHIPLGVHLPAQKDGDSREALSGMVPPGTVLLASFGYVAPSKRIDVVLRALARIRHESAPFHYLLVGEAGFDQRVARLIGELHLEDCVHQTGFVEDAEFDACMAATDIGINLRTGPTGGEMSATLLQLLAHGKPTLVSAVGGFTELPDDCVIKIRQDPEEEDQLVAILRRLIADPGLRAAYGRRARLYVEQEHSFTRVAAHYAGFIGECLEPVAGWKEAHA